MMRLAFALLLLFLVFSGALPAVAATSNPFISGNHTDTQKTAVHNNTSSSVLPASLSPLLVRISQWQLLLRKELVGYGHQIRQSPWSGAFWSFMLLSFCYGVIHALGPGHGKLFAATYFLNQPGTVKLGILFSMLTMFLHVLSATLLVLAAYFILHTSGALTVDAAGTRLEQISYGLLCCVGLVLTIRTVLEARKQKHKEREASRTDWKSFIGMTLAAGLVPCPGATLVLIFAVTLDILGTGLFAMCAIALGMSLTTGAVSLLAISSRGALLRLTARYDRWYSLAHLILSLGGSLAITFLGAVMLAGSFVAP